MSRSSSSAVVFRLLYLSLQNVLSILFKLILIKIRAALGNTYVFVSRPLFVTNVFKNSSSDLKKSNTEKLILLLLLSSFSSSSSSRNTQKKSSFFDGACRNVLGPLFVFFCNFCKKISYYTWITFLPFCAKF